MPTGDIFDSVATAQPVTANAGDIFDKVTQPQQQPDVFDQVAAMPPQPSTWQKIKNVFDTATSVPIPELIGKLFGPTGEAAAKVAGMTDPLNVGLGLLKAGSGELAESKNPVLSDAGKVAGTVADAEQGAIRSSQSPVGAIATITGAEPIQAGAKALPILREAVPAAAKAANLVFGSQGALNLIEPKQPNETGKDYAMRLGSGVLQGIAAIAGFHPALKDAAPSAIVVENESAKSALADALNVTSARHAEAEASAARLGPEFIAGEQSYLRNQLNAVMRNPSASAEEKSIAQAQLDHLNAPTVATDEAIHAANGNGHALVVADNSLPVVTRDDIVAHATSKLLESEQALKQAGIDVTSVQSPADIDALIKQAGQVLSDKVDPRALATISFSAQKQLAQSLDMGVDELLARKSGAAANAETAIASRAILADSRQSLLQAAKAASSGNKADVNTAITALARHQLILNQVKGQAAEAGRALGSYRIADADLPAVKVTNALASLNGMSPKAKAKAVQLLGNLDMNDEQAVNRFVGQITPSTTAQKLSEAYIQSLLSNPAVLIKKGASEVLLAGLETAKMVVAGSIERGRQLLTGATPQRFASEALLFAKGAWDALSDIPKVLSGKLQLSQMPDFERAAAGHAIKGSIGDIVNVPGTVLNRETNAVWLLNYRGALNSLAARQAIGEGLNGTELATRTAYLAANPTSELSAAAQEFALHNTFQSALGKTGRAITNLTNSHPLLKFVFPFVRTPINIAKTGLAEYSPIGLVRNYVKGDVDGLSRGILGTAIYAGIAHAVMAGYLTSGGPLSPAQREAWLDSGASPYSIHVGNDYIQVHRLEPLGLSIGLVADTVTAALAHGDTPSTEASLQNALRYIGRNLQDLPFLGTLSDVAALASGDIGRAGSWLQFESGSLVPAGMRVAARIADPTYRKPQSVTQAVEANIPGLSKRVPPVVGTTGEPVQRPTNELGGANPFPVTQQSSDAVANTLAGLSEAGISEPKDIKFAGQPMNMTRSERIQLQRQDAELLHSYLQPMIDGSDWHSLSEQSKRDLIADARKLVSSTRAARLEQLRLDRNPATRTQQSQRFPYYPERKQ